MSILSSPDIRPDMVRAVVRCLSLCEEEGQSELTDDEIVALMAPAVSIDADSGRTQRARVLELRNVSAELGFLQPGRWRLARPAPSDLSSFFDMVHERFSSEKLGEEFLLPYAALVVLFERDGADALAGTAKEFAERVRDHFINRDEKVDVTFNPTRVPAWRDWVGCLGLGCAGGERFPFIPNAADRLLREMAHISEAKLDNGMDARAFLAAIGARMPYLANGVLEQVAWRTGRDRPARTVSRVLSNALRDLHRSGSIELIHGGGDRAGAVSLADGGRPREPEAFARVRLMRETQ